MQNNTRPYLSRLSRWFVRFFRETAFYSITFIFFVAWMMLVDSYGYFPWRRLLAETRSLERQKTYYIEQNVAARRQIEALRVNRDSLEKFARERFLMKRPDEDLFIIIDD
ncbi:MAG: septum formation initiator family protein [Odoribacteraceae bacterium]|jgi:cell division protein FtsB|nr:septum formation initiator family protein [Odoribacteraceae bacterium]